MSKLISRFIIALIASTMLISPISANSIDGSSGQDLSLSSIGYSAQNLALAEANTAIIQNPFAVYNNPAGLSSLSNSHINSAHSKLSDDRELFSLSTAFPIFERTVVSLSWIQMQIAQIPIVDEDYYDLNTDIEPDSITSMISNGIIGAAAYSISDQLFLGLSASLFQEYYSTLSSKGYGLSLTPGFCYILDPDLSIGGYLKNAISTFKWNTDHQEELAKILHLGIYYRVYNINLFADANHELAGTSKINLAYGIELDYSFVKFRLGLYPEEVLLPLHHINAGVGLNLGSFSVDYSYIGNSENGLSDSSRINIGYKF